MTRSTTKPKAKPRTRRTSVPHGISEDELRHVFRDLLEETGLLNQERNLEHLVGQAARQAVHETFVNIGVDTKDPIKAQATFVALRNLIEFFANPETQADLNHLRTWRRSVDSMRSRSVLTLIAAATTGMLGLIVLGFREWTR